MTPAFYMYVHVHAQKPWPPRLYSPPLTGKNWTRRRLSGWKNRRNTRRRIWATSAVSTRARTTSVTTSSSTAVAPSTRRRPHSRLAPSVPGQCSRLRRVSLKYITSNVLVWLLFTYSALCNHVMHRKPEVAFSCAPRRQQREEIARKQERLDLMRNKKKDGLRPESPGSRRKRMARRLPVGARGQRLAGRTEVRHCANLRIIRVQASLFWCVYMYVCGRYWVFLK